MKKILITGANSYIGTSFENYIKQYEGYSVDTVDMIDGSWREYDFSGYDTVFHVAGIAHSDTGKASEEVKAKYYAVNTDLTIETAKKAKKDGAGQFIFMSSAIVFGSKQSRITKDTLPSPDNFYGDSKLKADEGIHKLQDEHFNVVSIRPPMIYGKGSKGNYPRLAKLARKTPVFANYPNKRSMLYIENLCEFVRLIIENNESGFFYPQNKEYVKTFDMVKTVANVYGKNIYGTRIFNPFVRVFKRVGVVNKVFGDLYYEKSLSEYKETYRIIDFEESIKRTESK
ncbi:MAG: NAD-dependent epimerase/dehydratase family protein [Clostridia bacterium]|nr:NAD-dependent epimerase/dehydratase family protein [Clostridia bacterium]